MGRLTLATRVARFSGRLDIALRAPPNPQALVVLGAFVTILPDRGPKELPEGPLRDSLACGCPYKTPGS